MKYSFSFILILGLMASCSVNDIGTAVVFSDKLVKIENGKEYAFKFEPSNKSILFCHISQKDCSVCAAEMLDVYYDEIIQHASISRPFETIFILSPNREDISTIAHILDFKHYKFTALIDTDNEIGRLNPQVFDKRFILLDSGLHVLSKSNHISRISDN